MQKNHYRIRIFVGCTAEMSPERHAVHAVSDEINRSIGDDLGVSFEVADWTTHTMPGAGRPQQVILDQLPVHTWDVFVGVLWLRFGTPSGGVNPATGRQYESGTEEEFEQIYAKWREDPRRHVLIFKCTREAPPGRIQPEQLQRVNRFFESFSPDGAHPGLIREFDSTEGFEKAMRGSLLRIAVEYDKKRQKEEIAEKFTPELVLPVDDGYLGFFTARNNEERNRRKRAALAEERSRILLLAHVGHSYLATRGNRFLHEVTTALEQGAKFYVVIRNPWTEYGLMVSLAEGESTAAGGISTRTAVAITPERAVTAIAQGGYYRFSLPQVIDQYKRLKQRFEKQIDLKVTTQDMPATILLTSRVGFFEPYVSANLEARLRTLLHTFEVEFASGSGMYLHSQAYFDYLWDTGCQLEDFEVKQDSFRQRFQALFDQHRQPVERVSAVEPEKPPQLE